MILCERVHDRQENILTKKYERVHDRQEDVLVDEPAVFVIPK
jgi:hypothetical protein